MDSNFNAHLEKIHASNAAGRILKIEFQDENGTPQIGGLLWEPENFQGIVVSQLQYGQKTYKFKVRNRTLFYRRRQAKLDKPPVY